MHRAARLSLFAPALLVFSTACGPGQLGGEDPVEPDAATTSATGATSGGATSGEATSGGATSDAAGSGTAGAGGMGIPGTTGGSGAADGASCPEAPSQHVGVATYYAADGSGNCGFDPTGDLMVGAMNNAEFAGSAVCGACVHIQGPVGEAVVKIVDKCPECPPGAIDLSPLAFGKLADLSLGKIPIQWEYVDCDMSGPIHYHFKPGSNPWWSAVQIRNARVAIAKLEYRKDGQYVEVPRTDYNYFVDAAGMGQGPYAFRVTDVNGSVLEDEGVPFVEGGDVPGAAQFPSCKQ